jgi:hypothetical protein
MKTAAGSTSNDEGCRWLRGARPLVYTRLVGYRQGASGWRIKMVQHYHSAGAHSLSANPLGLSFGVDLVRQGLCL